MKFSMGSRGAFVNVSLKDFTFNTGVGANQQSYKTVGVVDEVYYIGWYTDIY